MNERYCCVPLTSDKKNLEDIKDFQIDREADVSCIDDEVIGLEAYLKRLAWTDDLNGDVKIYLIKDRVIGGIAAYFGLKAGMVVNNEEGVPTKEEKEEVLEEYNAKLVSAVVPGIEISHFAVNDNYRRQAGSSENPIRGLGEYFYPKFIFPIIEDVAEKIGVKIIYLYAAGDERLENYYKKVFGFYTSRLNDFYIPLQPGYDGGCRFMYYVREKMDM